MQLFYHPEIEANDQEVIFPKDESKHIVKVLRKKAGDVLDVTNGKGHFFQVEITVPSPSKCAGKIISAEAQKKHDYFIHMAVAPTKLNDRYEWFLEKATEIGLDQVTPIICDHSERKVIKNDRYDRILQSAMKQSLKAHMPQLDEEISFKEFCAQDFSNYDQKFIAHCEEDQQRFSLKNRLSPKNKTLILIGPEGDFSPEEINLAKAKGFEPVTLGESRLRTETAAVVATSYAAFVNED